MAEAQLFLCRVCEESFKSASRLRLHEAACKSKKLKRCYELAQENKTTTAEQQSPMHLPDILQHVSRMQEVLSADNINSELRNFTTHYSAVLNLQSPLRVATHNLSVDCVNQTFKFLSNLRSRSPWALSMLDAQAKIPSGVLNGNFLWLGNYEQCLSVRALGAKNESLFRGKYCSAQIFAPVLQGQSITLGLCLPDICDKDDLKVLVLAALEELKQQAPVKTNCQPVEAPSPDAAAICVICLLSLVAFVVLAATLYDILIYQPVLLCPPDEVLLPQTPPEPLLTEPSTNDAGQHRSTLDVTDYTPLFEREDVAEEHAKFVQSNTSAALRAFLAFSAYSNGAKLVSTRVTSEGDLGAIHGIRLFSMSWVLLGHSFAFPLAYADNLVSFMPRAGDFTFQAIVNASVSVDSFFFLSGTLVSYLLLREMAKRVGPMKVSWLKFYFHRYWRLTPTLLITLGFFICVFPFMGEGPLWNPDMSRGPCHNSWWSVPLYINNLYKPGDQCMGWVWYLANDMQFFIISPLFIIPLYMYPIFGVIWNIAGIASCCVSTGYITYIHSFPADFPMYIADPKLAMTDSFYQIYIAPWCRKGAYLIGVLCGFTLYKTSTSLFKMHWSVVVAGWAAAAALALSVIYGLLNVSRGHMISWELNAFYSAVHREVWALALFWLVFACCRGYGGPVNAILSWRPLVPLSRLTYCAYLVHPIVIFWNLMSLQSPFHLTLPTLSWFFVGNLGVTYAVALLLSLALEAPLLAIEKIFLL
ncbi:hypothetical protein CAPTEDRAFT_227362 [Capitella teleta]|uniref:Nose resistant-to-fluoxetine protein N-terminal domain-containing protein n=1 Tax=Capitella teleta TaxID=283909 RepID=R7TIV2_CAPTE|nr:hypothetical protein CAPTEDRAFT_227362 [Capitella teleta]|eukprot:ELT93753.1 hypothetical protein CAPTEDRAFT_227362 [Capitella teleta]